MKRWSTACPDWEVRIVNRQSLVPAPLFPESAEAALKIFKALPVVDLPWIPDGQGGMRAPTFGEVCRQWVFDFVAAIFGASDPETGERLINEFLLLISKKNGKSTIAAGIMMTALLLNWRIDNGLIILAPTIEVAKNAAGPAIAMVQRNADLAEVLRAVPHERRIVHRTTGAELKIIAADTEVVGGSKAGFVLIDEAWLFGKMARAEDMFREAIGGLASRPEGFVIKLSTMSDAPPAGVFKSDLERFRGIRDGKLLVPNALGVLYEFPPAMIKAKAYDKPENWYVTNPNLGASVRESFLAEQFSKDAPKGAAALAGFYAKHLNVEIGVNLRGDRWAGADHWEKRADESVTLESILRRCEVVVAALDGGGLDDLYGLTILGREVAEVEIESESEVDGVKVSAVKRDKRWLSWSHAWCHRGVLQLRQSIASKLLDLEAAAELTIVDDALDDISDIVGVIEKIKDAGLLFCVAVDPAGLGEMIDALAEIDVVQENKEAGANFVIGVNQGYGLMNAIKTCERKLVNGSLIHAKQPLMDWAVGNLKIEPTATAIRATKQNAGDAKIDPAMALFNAATVMATNPAPTSAPEVLIF